jgi:hypothetical protein
LVDDDILVLDGHKALGAGGALDLFVGVLVRDVVGLGAVGAGGFQANSFHTEDTENTEKILIKAGFYLK